MDWYRGKRVFITGGSSGIGKATAKLLAQAGANVIIGARGEQRLHEALEELNAVPTPGGQTFGTVTLDVADLASVERAATEVKRRLGGLDILINNAGQAHPGYVQDVSPEVYETMMRVNYFGPVWVTRAFLPTFMEQRSGHIANVASLLGYMGIFGYSAYAASKFAIVGFSDCLRQDLLPYGVGVSVLFPPDTDTPQLAEENRFKPAETKAIAGNVKVMSAEAVAKELLDGMAAGKYHILPGFDNKMTYFLYRHFPWLVRWKIDGDLRKYRKKNGGTQVSAGN
ncbi:MAG: SDR family oxidoreductase [Deltaproteobacteria bacterium]|nr:SDR family oxidoreductase [Deltaproteobacteria bacterium]